MAINSELRDYQVMAINRLFAEIRKGSTRPVLQLPTGSGKTLIAAKIVDMALEAGKRIAFVVPAISLIDQTVLSFWREGINAVGVQQADHDMTDPKQPVQVCSIATLARRNNSLDVDCVIIDECHINSEFRNDWMVEPRWQSIPFIGLSATPWAAGMAAHWSSLTVMATTQDMIDLGHLSKFEVFVPSHPDLSNVKVIAGDYQEDQLGEVMSDATLVADIVETWLKLGGNQPTLCFCVNLAHARIVHEAFTRAGVPSAFQEAKTPREERDMIATDFERGDTRVVCNVGTLCLDEETEILTDSGWVGIDEMTYDHRVAAWAETGVRFTNPSHIVRRDRRADERMVSLQGRIHNIRVTSNHRMLWSKSPSGFNIISAEDIAGLSGFIPVSGHAVPKIFDVDDQDENRDRLRHNGLTHRYRKVSGMTAKCAEAFANEHREHLKKHCSPKPPHDLSIDECLFIGFWIGDGSRYGGRFSVTQSKRYPKIIQWVDDIVERLGLHVTRHVNQPATKTIHESIRWCFSTGRGGIGQRVTGGLSPIIPYLEKNGTPLFWGLDTAQFEAVLYGYWLADGNHGRGDGEGKGKRISGSSLELFELLQSVGACRGYRIALTQDRGKHRKTPFYRITWLKQSSSRLVRQRLQIEEGFREERVWCVTSTTGNIITRRKGKVAVVGNTTGIDWDVRCLILARPTKSKILFTQIIGRALRPADGKLAARILDHSDTHLRLGLVTDIHADQLSAGRKMAGTSAADRDEPLPKECKKCSWLKPAGMRECPNCGFIPEKVAVIETMDGELKILNGKKGFKGRKYTAQERREWYAEALGWCREKGKKDGMAYHAYKRKFDKNPATPRPLSVQCSVEVRNYMQSRLIAFAKSKGPAAAANKRLESDYIIGGEV